MGQQLGAAVRAAGQSRKWDSSWGLQLTTAGRDRLKAYDNDAAKMCAAVEQSDLNVQTVGIVKSADLLLASLKYDDRLGRHAVWGVWGVKDEGDVGAHGPMASCSYFWAQAQVCVRCVKCVKDVRRVTGQLFTGQQHQIH
eukprot:364955-Chlamydomonas_euryale.AAC.14